MQMMELKGGAELDRKLRQLLPAQAKRVLKKSLKAGASVFRDAGRANARSMVGGEMGKKIARSLRATARMRKKRTRQMVLATMEVSAKFNEEFVEVSATGRRNYIPAAIEYGHDNVAAIPFMRSAFDSRKGAALQAVIKVTGSEIAKEAAKKK